MISIKKAVGAVQTASVNCLQKDYSSLHKILPPFGRKFVTNKSYDRFS